MKEINTLDELFTFLSSCKRQDITRLSSLLNLEVNELKPYQHWNKDSYTRNCIKRTDHYEVLLLCWEGNQKTPIHSHDDKDCLVQVIAGNMVERFYKQDNDVVETGHTNLEKNGISYIGDKRVYHALTNASDKPAITLHIYINPIEKCEVYDSERKQFSIKTMTDHSFHGKCNH